MLTVERLIFINKTNQTNDPYISLVQKKMLIPNDSDDTTNIVKKIVHNRTIQFCSKLTQTFEQWKKQFLRTFQYEEAGVKKNLNHNIHWCFECITFFVYDFEINHNNASNINFSLLLYTQTHDHDIKIKIQLIHL